MSEYAAGTPRPQSLDDLDATGTLFEGAERQPQRRDRGHEIGHQSVRRVIVGHPHTTAELRARHHSDESSAEAREDAYHELGGNLSGYDQLPLFDQLAEDFQPWMTDIDIAINHLGLHEIGSDTIQRMTKTDRRLLAMHVDALLERMSTAERLIGAAEGNVSNYVFLEKRYGKERTPEELLGYMPTLRRLSKAIHEQHIMGALHQGAPEVFKKSRADRNKAYDRYLRNHHGPITVGYDPAHNLRVEQQ